MIPNKPTLLIKPNKEQTCRVVSIEKVYIYENPRHVQNLAQNLSKNETHREKKQGIYIHQKNAA